MNLQQEDLRVQVVGLVNKGGLKVLVAELFKGRRSEGVSGWVVQRRDD